MPSNRPKDRLEEILENGGRILSYVDGMDQQSFGADQKTIDAVERCLMRMSEAAYKLGAELDGRYPSAGWRNLRGLGNPLRHQYDMIRPEEIWTGIQVALPAILASAQEELDRLATEEDRLGL